MIVVNKKTLLDIIELDRNVLLHPFTRIAEWERSTPLVIKGGKGSTLFDHEGRAYLDGTSSLWVNLLGHRNPAIDDAIRSQLDRIAHSTFLGLTHEEGVLLAQELLAIAPLGLSRVFYSDNGSTAVEIALKLSYLLSQRSKSGRGSRFFSLERSYHGDTLGAVGVGGIHRFHDPFLPLTRESLKAPAPDCAHCPLDLKRETCSIDCADVAVGLLRQHREELSGVILEPRLQAAGGMIVWPPGYLSRLSNESRKLEIPLILDEVATGFGRTGAYFACQLENVTPDFLCVGKGLTGGYLPLAATLFSEESYRKLKKDPGIFYHGHSYTANPLAVSAARATLSQLEETRVLSEIPRKRSVFDTLETRLTTLPPVGNIRSIGLIFAFDLFRDAKNKLPANETFMSEIQSLAQEMGLIIRPLLNTIYLIPPLSVSMEDLETMSERLLEAVRKMSTAM
ncbi:MAG: adenosylmethionine--8-amino-7-oxononanoate transaminase [Leptospirales bacterium]